MESTTVYILETSDIHGHIYPYAYGDLKNAPIGLGRIATYVKRMRKRCDHLLLIDNGDLFQGTPLFTYYIKNAFHKRNPYIEILNTLHYDGAVIGNHEFNYGMDVLDQCKKEAAFPYLAANIIDNRTKQPYFGTPYVTKTFTNGIKAVVLGVTTHYIPNWENPSHITNLEFLDAFETTKKWVSFLQQSENPDLMIVSYHGGFEHDVHTGKSTGENPQENQGYRMCHEIQGIDVLLTGHQHQMLATEVNGVSIVQPGMNGERVGTIKVDFHLDNGKRKIAKKKSSLISMDGMPVDKKIISIVEILEKDTQEWLNETIGTIDGNMHIEDPFLARQQEHPFIEFINKVQMDATGVDISCTALFNDKVNGLPTDVSIRDILSNYIYPNTLSVLELTGEDIRQALEKTASYFMITNDGKLGINPSFTTPKPQHYNYDMWEGIQYILDIRLPIGKRVTSLTYKGKPLQEKKRYPVVMNNYRAGGGGGYPMFKNKPILKEIQLDMTELITNYFLTHQTIQATCNHNWKVIL
ncbi:bifunctional metallophosphatase/5'-nucleotidase [Rossellomorea aquimaris]|uniref:bifunctional metallophosphatase/5'-nucleotidase n=1 Tax=Rossellomorea aquimaris TaxID=189382 RepID=UPI0007D0AD28|nr:bifunctional UDP-sugar hydrolase/5'-nucleotidase [Rossellomorea aquimaris]